MRLKVIFTFALFVGLLFSCGPRSEPVSPGNEKLKKGNLPAPSSSEGSGNRAERHNTGSCAIFMDKIKGTTQSQLLVLSEDDFAIASGGVPYVMILKKQISASSFEGIDGIQIRASSPTSPLGGYHAISRSVRLYAGDSEHLMDQCFEAYVKDERQLTFYFTESTLIKKLRDTQAAKERDILFRFFSNDNPVRVLNILFPIESHTE